MNVKIYTSQNIEHLKWASHKNGHNFKLYFLPLIVDGANYYVKNIYGKVGLISANNQLIPFVLGNYKHKKTSYVASNIAQYIDYAEDEILSNSKYSKILKVCSPLLFSALRGVGKLLKFDDAIFVNSWLLSTNLYHFIYEVDFLEITEALTLKYPNKAIVFKSVCGQTHSNLLDNLIKAGCRPIISRQVYLLNFSKSEYFKKRPYQQDVKFWFKEHHKFDWKIPAEISAFEINQILKFYNDLYIKKYSIFNPNYTNLFISLAHQSRFLNFYLLYKNNTLLAAQAIAENSFEVNTPLIGYDQNLPQKLGLYRMMNLKLMDVAKTKNKLLNMSSGAAKFKKQRGGNPAFEFNLVYMKHISFTKKIMYFMFGFVGEKFVMPAMKKFEV